MTSGTRRVVCVSFPPVEGRPEMERLRTLDARIELVSAPYFEDEARRRSRHLNSPAELRATAAPLGETERHAFARAEVILAFDLPVGLGELAPNLRWVHCIGAGVEHLAGSGLRERGVVLTNSSGVAARAISEFVIGRILAIWKRFAEQLEHQRAKRWMPTYGRMIAGSVIGIVGLGAIGGAVAKQSKALGARVLGMRRRPIPSADVDEMFTPDRLHEMLSRCDAVVLAAPASDETLHLIDRRAIEAMRPGAVLCNVARGSLVDEEALAEAIRDGRIGAAALDVFETEPLPAESPLWELPNTYISAHSAVSIDRYLEDVIALFAENLGSYLRGEPLRNVVEAPS